MTGNCDETENISREIANKVVIPRNVFSDRSPVFVDGLNIPTNEIKQVIVIGMMMLIKKYSGLRFSVTIIRIVGYVSFGQQLSSTIFSLLVMAMSHSEFGIIIILGGVT